MLLTHCTDDQPNGHRSASPIDQFEWKGLGAARWKISKVQAARFADFNLKINITLKSIISGTHSSDVIYVVRTPIAGFSAMPTSTTFLANILALAASSVSADAGQEQTLRTHW